MNSATEYVFLGDKKLREKRLNFYFNEIKRGGGY